MAKTLSKQTRSNGAGGTLAPWLGIAVVVILADQLTKIAINKVFSYGEGRVITPFFNLVLVYNKGAAFSFLSAAGGWQRWFFIALAVAASAFMVYLLRRNPGQRLFSFAIAMVMGGAIGNVIDRIARGAVVDFISLHWHRAYTFPAFNLADSAITLGAICLLVDELLRVRRG